MHKHTLTLDSNCVCSKYAPHETQFRAREYLIKLTTKTLAPTELKVEDPSQCK